MKDEIDDEILYEMLKSHHCMLSKNDEIWFASQENDESCKIS